MFLDPGPVGCSTLESNLARVVWVVGPAALIALAWHIAHEPGYSIVDVWFVVAFAASVVARYLDVSRFGGATLGGEPATMAHAHAYTLKLLMSATGAWGIAHWAPSAP